jgi:hypothetical protein
LSGDEAFTPQSDRWKRCKKCKIGEPCPFWADIARIDKPPCMQGKDVDDLSGRNRTARVKVRMRMKVRMKVRVRVTVLQVMSPALLISSDY